MKELITIENDPTDILRATCKPVRAITAKPKSVGADLVQYLNDNPGSKVKLVALSAPQLGENIRVIAYYTYPAPREKRVIQVLFNPEIVKSRKFANFLETCLSIPGKEFIVRRARQVKVKGMNILGMPCTVKGQGLLAQILQHEIDHLDGVLIDSIGEEVS